MKKYEVTREETIVEIMRELVADAEDTVWFDDYTTMFDHLASKLKRATFVDAFTEYA